MNHLSARTQKIDLPRELIAGSVRTWRIYQDIRQKKVPCATQNSREKLIRKLCIKCIEHVEKS